MKTKQGKKYIILMSLFCAIAVAFVDGVIQPGYGVKSAIKSLLFLCTPLLYYLAIPEGRETVKSLFRPKKRAVCIALGLGGGVYVLILLFYWAVTRFIDLSGTILELTAQNGVTPENFAAVAVYIPIVNSFLEEFLFRGFAFLSLKRISSRRFAYIFSAAVFAVYHFGMVAGTGEVLVWGGSLVGLFIAGVVLNFLNEKSGSILISWLVHMCANLAINTIGLRVFGLI